MNSICIDAKAAGVNASSLYRMYTQERLGIREISDVLGVSISTARRRLLAAGVEFRPSGEGLKLSLARRETPRKTRSFTQEQKKIAAQQLLAGRRKKAKGVSLKKNGYLGITLRDSPNYQRGVHVVTMERHIGRRINRDEVVHHIDGNKLNNDIRNLQLMTRAEHSRLHRLEEISKGMVKSRSSNGKFMERSE